MNRLTKLLLVLSTLASMLMGAIQSALVPEIGFSIIAVLFLALVLNLVPMLVLHFLFLNYVRPKLSWPWIIALLAAFGSIALIGDPVPQTWNFPILFSAIWFLAVTLLDESSDRLLLARGEFEDM